jgi:hypothetical protein
VTAPVEPLNEVTPTLFRVTEDPKATEPPPANPTPAVTVTEELAREPLVTPPALILLHRLIPRSCWCQTKPYP